MSSITQLTDATFSEEVGASELPVVVDFWAEWCGPCKQIAPVLEEISSEKADTLRVGKVNVDENQGLARQFDVMSIPTLLVFKDGAPVGRIVGAKPKAQLLQEIESYL